MTIGVGLGSVVQHGPAPAWNPIAHDPPLFGVLTLATGAAITVSLLRASRSPRLPRRLLVALGLLAVGAALGTLGRPGGTLRDPGSWLQTHAVWHLLAAVTLWALAPVVGHRAA